MLKPVKAHKEYDELVDLLLSKGMTVPDKAYAIKKISQVGYYRLSGFWYPCRLPCNIQGKIKNRLGHFYPGTRFQSVYDLYLFDKNLRLLMIDALERIEIYVRSIIAHEIGRISPTAYLDHSFINPKHLSPRTNTNRTSAWIEWSAKHSNELKKSREDFIKWHNIQYAGLPFWTVIDVWDFGLMSKYYAMLKDTYRNIILSRLGIPAGHGAILENWLSAMNVLRNRCAHHSRIWNKVNQPKLKSLPNDPYFNLLKMDNNAHERMYGMIAVIWYLIKIIGPNSYWINDVANLIDEKPKLPGCDLTSMGFTNNNGFPRRLFDIN